MSHSIRPLPALSAVFAALFCGSVHAQVEPPAPVTPPPAAVPAPGTVTPVTGGEGDDFLPAAFVRERHRSTWENSAFSREVLPPPAPESGPTGPGPEDGWRIAAVDGFGPSGKFTVGLINKKNEFYLLTEGVPHEDAGITITKVESTGVISETVIHVSDGSDETRTGTITFDSKRLAQAPKGAPGAPKGGTPRPGGRPGGRPQPQTPQQRAAAAAAQREAQATLGAHLTEAAAKGGRPAPPAPGTAPATGQGNQTPPTPPSRSTKRRSVVLPPSGRR